MTVSVHDFAQSYEFRADDGDHTPNDAERAMIEDAIHGYLDALTTHPSPVQGVAEAMREAAAALCARFVTPYGRAGSAPDAVESAVHRMAAAIRALPIPAAEAESKPAGTDGGVA